jgi:GMP synthase-like glutamine amidotransferase
MKHIHAFFHVPFEGLGYIQEWIEERSFSLTSTNWWEESYQNQPFDMLIIMGGPMGVYDETELGWMSLEKQVIRDAIQSGKKVIGICLGAQLIADVLGSKVYPHNQKEIGWFPISGQTPLDGLTVFHWHGDTYDLPKDAVLVASSTGCEQQAFRFGNHVLGLQFHLEVRPEDVQSMVKHEGHELIEAEFVMNAEAILAEQKHFSKNSDVLFGLLDGLIGVE